MKLAIKETNRRRKKQMAYNKQHGITPQTITKHLVAEEIQDSVHDDVATLKQKVTQDDIATLELQMQVAAENLDFERAIKLRDQVAALRK